MQLWKDNEHTSLKSHRRRPTSQQETESLVRSTPSSEPLSGGSPSISPFDPRRFRQLSQYVADYAVEEQDQVDYNLEARFFPCARNSASRIAGFRAPRHARRHRQRQQMAKLFVQQALQARGIVTRTKKEGNDYDKKQETRSASHEIDSHEYAAMSLQSLATIGEDCDASLRAKLALAELASSSIQLAIQCPAERASTDGSKNIQNKMRRMVVWRTFKNAMLAIVCAVGLIVMLWQGVTRSPEISEDRPENVWSQGFALFCCVIGIWASLGSMSERARSRQKSEQLIEDLASIIRKGKRDPKRNNAAV